MKRCILIVSILFGGLVLTNAAVAGDVEDIKKATMEHFATLNAGNVAAHVAHHMTWHSVFVADGSLLQVNDSLEDEKKSLQADVDAGVKLNLQLRHLDVKVYGNTAVVTGYVVGTVTDPEGKTQQVMDRRTAVLVKEGSKWMEVHVHSSPVMAAQSQ